MKIKKKMIMRVKMKMRMKIRTNRDNIKNQDEDGGDNAVMGMKIIIKMMTM